MIIDFKKAKIDLSAYSTTEEVQQMIDDSLSGVTVDLSAYWTSAQTETAINEATSEFVTSGQVQTQIDEAIGDIDFSSFATSADTAAINDHLTDVERVASIAINDLNSRVDDIVIPDVSEFVTSAETLTQINNSLADYYTSAQTDTKIAEAISEIDLSEIEGEISTLSGKVQTNEEVTAAALNNLNTRANSFVVGDGITTIKKISQTDYDALVSGGTVDSNCFYAITGTTN